MARVLRSLALALLALPLATATLAQDAAPAAPAPTPEVAAAPTAPEVPAVTAPAPEAPAVEAAPAAEPAPAIPAGRHGCPSSFWKENPGAWPAAYTPATLLPEVFGQTRWCPDFAEASLQQALSLTGKQGIGGSMQRLVRAGVVALLNSAKTELGYPRATADVIAAVDTALGTANVGKMDALSKQLEADNGLGCPLK